MVPYEDSDVHGCRHRWARSRPDSLLLEADEAPQHESGHATKWRSENLRGLGLPSCTGEASFAITYCIDLAAILRAPARASCNSHDAFPCFFAGDNEWALGTCPACAADIGPTHTLNNVRRSKILLLQVLPYRQQFLLLLLFIQIMSLQERRQKQMDNIPARHVRWPKTSRPGAASWNCLWGVGGACAAWRKPADAAGILRCNAKHSLSIEEHCRPVEVASQTLS